MVEILACFPYFEYTILVYYIIDVVSICFQCSASCGTGFKTREVKCMDPDLIHSVECTANYKPSRRQTCNTDSCHKPQLDAGQAYKQFSCITVKCDVVEFGSRWINYMYNHLACHSFPRYQNYYRIHVDGNRQSLKIFQTSINSFLISTNLYEQFVMP